MLKIVDIVPYFPKEVITSDDFKRGNPDWDWDRIRKATGVEQVNKAERDEYAVDMGRKAAEKLIEQSQIDKDSIDYLFWISLNNHYIIPSPAFELARLIGLSGKVGVSHNNLGCTGFLNVLMFVQGLFATNSAKRVLVVTSTNVRKYLHPENQGTYPLFGDVASAVLIDKDEEKGLLPFVYGSDASFVPDIIIKDGAERYLYSSESYKPKVDKFGSTFSDATLYMNSVSTFNATLSKTEMMLKELEQVHQVDFREIDKYFFHQSSFLTLRFIQKKFKIPQEKMMISIEKRGNTIESALPLGMFDAIQSGKLKRGDKILLSVFGIGFSWISTVLEY
ncbi:MAG: ketoacyl-ACP synthase III [Bacteroidales bacterium]|nr:ketoacyl-ACP synthase III [Bacteroidales bacterium]